MEVAALKRTRVILKVVAAVFCLMYAVGIFTQEQFPEFARYRWLFLAGALVMLVWIRFVQYKLKEQKAGKKK